MTTLLSSRPQQHQQPPPAPLDQPTPVSPPFFMSSNHASESMTSEKYQQNSIQNTSSSPAGSSRPPTVMATTTSLPTPTGSIAPNGSHEDTEGDVIMDDSGWSNCEPNGIKRRRTSSSSDRPATMAPNLRHRDGKSSAASPYVLPPGVLELISNPDVSPYHLVCQKQYQPSYPDVSEDILQLYDLDSLVRKVQRVDAEGKKNKLRKSYKGFISHLSGKHDVQPERTQFNPYTPMEDGTEENARRRLYYLSQWPEDDFMASQVHGKEIGRGFDKERLRRGVMTFSKGMLPGFDQSSLGLDDERQPKNSVSSNNHRNPANPTAMNSGPSWAASDRPVTSRLNGIHTTPGTPVAGGINRPNRPGKRRRYDESSYEGYEGYQDDDGGGAAAWKAKKQKKMGMVGGLMTGGP